MKLPRLLLLLLSCACFLAGCGERQVPPPRAAANDFFQAISESRFQAAYDSTAFAFQAKINFNSFRAVARDLKLTDSPVSCEWEKEEKADDEAKLTGHVSVADGKPITVIVKLVRERGAWRIFAVHDTANPSQKEVYRFSMVGKTPELTRPSSTEPPNEAAAQKLVRDALLLFNDALARKDFGDFYTQVSAAWQRQLTVGQLKRSFQPFIDANVNLDEVAKVNAVFDVPPQVDSQGILNLKGHYPLKKQQANFILRYTFEFPYWKLFGVSIELNDPDK